MKTSLALLLAGLYILPAGGSRGPLPPPVPAFVELPPPPHAVPWRYAESVYLACQEESVPYWIAARLFAWESGWKPSRVNLNEDGSVDTGLAMGNSRYHAWFSEAFNAGIPIDFFDGHEAVRFGVRYLAYLYRETGSWSGAVGAYNCGPGRWRSGDLPERTKRHIKAVMGW